MCAMLWRLCAIEDAAVQSVALFRVGSPLRRTTALACPLHDMPALRVGEVISSKMASGDKRM